MHSFSTKRSGWKAIVRELFLLVIICLLVLLTAKFARADRMAEPAGSSPNSQAAPASEELVEPAAVNLTNYALKFDGADDFARVIDVGNFDFATTLTIEAWVKPESVTGTGLFRGLVSGRENDLPNTSGGWVMFLPTADHSQWGLSVCSGGCDASTAPAGSLVVDEWHHLAATYDGATIKIYQDGALVGSTPHSGDVTDVNYLFIGAWAGTFHGLMDEVRVWNTGRTPEAIRSTMITKLQGNEPGLVAYWPFDEGTGQFATDVTGNGQKAQLGSSDGIDSKDPTWIISDVPIIPPAFQLVPLLAGLETDIGISSIFAPGFRCGWSPGETVEVWWDDPEIKLATFIVDGMGCFEGQFPLADERVGSSKTGTHEVQARGSVSGVVPSPFELVVPQLHLNPAQGPSAVDVSISGCGWGGAPRVNIYLQPANDLLGRPAVDPSNGCIDDTLRIPKKKDGLHGLFAITDDGSLVSGASYWVRGATIVLTPNEGPPGARVPLAGCNWFSEELINFSFTGIGQIFDTWGTSLGGCITTGGPTEPTLSIPITATLGAKIIRATGVDSGQVVNVPFTVIERSLVFDPDNGQPNDPIAASGCGWVGNDDVTLEWGYPDTNNLPIRWLTNVDGSNGCFGSAGDFFIDVPDNTISGSIVVTATGGTIGLTTATFNVAHPGTIEIPLASGYAGYTTTVDIVDAIIGETIFFKWDSSSIAFDGVGAATSDFSHEITLPDYASVGLHTVTAEGTKGFDDQDTINILDNAQLAVVTGGDIYPEGTIKVEGTDWSAGERISFELQKGGDTWPITKIVTVPSGVLDFNVNLTLPSNLSGGQYTLSAMGNKGRDAATNLTITALPPPAFTLTAAFADPPPDLDGSLRSGEWDYGANKDFNNGFITARSDETRLYILLDLLADTGNDSLGNDNYWLSFDILNKRQIDPGWDLNFRLDGSGDLILEEYSGPDSFDPHNSVNLRSAYGGGFGCYFADGSFSLTFNGFLPRFSCSKHRIFEIGIDLATIGAEPGDLVRLGLRAFSQSPAFSEDIPNDFTSDFSKLGTIALAPSRLAPNPPTGTVTGIGSNGFEVEVTQAIQDVNNDLRLVADKETVVRVYPEVADEAMVRVFLFGQKNNQDLPGSPLVLLATIPAAIDREALNNTANFLLPASWVTEGITEFTAVAENLDGFNVTAVQESVVFYERRVPVIWAIPFNEGTAAAPILPTQTDMVAQERVLEGLLPTPSVTFLHRPWTDIGATGPISFTTMKKDLNSYWTMLSLAKFLSGDTSPMPDLLYGFKVSRDPKAVGTSDPVYSGGNGRVVVGQADGRDFNSTTMIHEVNHDLDRSRVGTWGRHVANPTNVKDRSWGCDAGGPDLSWPYTGNDNIQEVGFDAANPWDDGTGGHLTVLPTNRNDFMSYCWHKGTPIQWISPYRWQAMFSKFAPLPLAPALPLTPTIGSVYYLSGQLDKNGTGSLDPILVLPGISSTDIVSGAYSIEVQNSAQVVLQNVPFVAVFTGTEGVPLESLYFNYQLPVQANAAKILLKHNDQVLDIIIPSLNAPTIEVTVPGDGDSWSDQETISWLANDLDGDPLQFMILYSPDEGSHWYPVAADLTGNEYTVDVDRLPGGTGGKIQLIASDGFHTVQAQSTGTFTVPHPAPIVTIDTPADEQTFIVNEWINLTGNASAVSGTTTDIFTYTWSINGQPIEVGSKVKILPGEGEHTITLTAYDEHNNYGQASLTVLVLPIPPSNIVFLPAIQR